MGRRLEYTQEEKVAAIKLVTEGGRTIPSVANEYGIHENTLWNGSDSTRSTLMKCLRRQESR